MPGRLLALFSARQLLWVTITVLVTGGLLLVPIFVRGDVPKGPWTSFLRHAHSASSVVLVLGALLHAGARVVRAPMGVKAVATGIGASSAVALAALSGAALVQTDHWSNTLGMEPTVVGHAAAIFHYGYSAALVAGFVLWHARGPTARLLPRMDAPAVAWALLLPALAALAAPRQVAASPYTAILAPPLLVIAAWPLIAPQFGWVLLVTRRGPRQTP